MLSKEIEFQGLEVELQNKKIGEAQRAIDSRKADVENAKHQLEERRADLDMKKSELDDITAETKAEEEKLRVCSSLSSVSAKIHATVWASFMYSVMPVVVASTKSRPSASSTFVCAKKSSYANTAAAS